VLRIPLQTVPNQTLAVTLVRQAAQIALRQNGLNLYFDLLFGGNYIVRTKICRDRQRLLSSAQYLGFSGDFVFVDTQGTNEPDYTGLGDATARYQLIYLAAGE
jgi:hypothetical protein